MLNTVVKAPVYESRTYGEASYLDAVLVWNQEQEELTMFAVNKDLEEDMEVSCDLRQFADYRIVEHQVLTHTDLKAVNTEENPDEVTVKPEAGARLEEGKLTAVLGETKLADDPDGQKRQIRMEEKSKRDYNGAAALWRGSPVRGGIIFRRAASLRTGCCGAFPRGCS